jgi:hypothetical protein
MALSKDKRHTEQQAVAFAKKATQQSQFHGSRRDRTTNLGVIRTRSHGMALTSRWRVVNGRRGGVANTPVIEFRPMQSDTNFNLML